MAFKIRDKVKLKDYSHYDDHRRHKGQTGTVDGVDTIHNTISVNWDNGEHSTVWLKESYPYKTRGRPRKEKPVKYIVIFDENDGDPAKKFISRKELIAWIKEAKKDNDIVFGSIEVYPVSERLEVELKTNVSLKKSRR